MKLKALGIEEMDEMDTGYDLIESQEPMCPFCCRPEYACKCGGD